VSQYNIIPRNDVKLFLAYEKYRIPNKSNNQNPNFKTALAQRFVHWKIRNLYYFRFLTAFYEAIHFQFPGIMRLSYLNIMKNIKND